MRVKSAPHRERIAGVVHTHQATALIGLLTLGVVASLLVAPGHVRATSPIPSVASSAGADPRNLTFYLHNATAAQSVNGVTSPYLFDTLKSFGRNVTVSAVQQVRQDWYLYPTLAGNLTVNGTMTLHAYVSASGTTPNINPTLSIYNRTPAGVENLVWSGNFGNILWWNSPHDLVLTTIPLLYTFTVGSSIHVILDVTAGTRTATIWWNASWVPSNLILQSNDFAHVSTIAFLDHTGKAGLNFDLTVPNKALTIQANATDPLGGYDLHWVNVTLVQPGGVTILSSLAMSKTSGSGLSFTSTFQYPWNYSGRPVGPYNATVTVADNSAYYYWAATRSWTGNLMQGTATFYLGGYPYYVNLRAVDSQGKGLPASLRVLSAGVTIQTVGLDDQGRSNVSLQRGPYSLEVYWQLIQVANLTYTVTGNVSASAPFIIPSAVYYATITARDSLSLPLAGAALILQHPNGTQFGPIRTDAQGQVHLDRMAAGSYGVEADWRGVQVFQSPVAIAGDGDHGIDCSVFELTIKVVDGANGPLVGAFVSLQDSTGLVFDANITDASGNALLLLPAGTYDVKAEYNSAYLGSEYGAQGNTQVVLDSNKATQITLAISQPPITSTVIFPLVLALVLSLTALAGTIFLLWRGRRPGPGAAAARPGARGGLVGAFGKYFRRPPPPRTGSPPT